MKRFRFRLQSVLDYRAHIEEMRERELARAMAELRIAESARDAIATTRQTEMEKLRLEVTKRDEMTGWELMARRDYLDRLSWRLAEANESVAAGRQRAKDARDVLMGARRDRRILQKLHDRALDKHRSETAKEEMSLIDNITQARVARARAAAEV